MTHDHSTQPETVHVTEEIQVNASIEDTFDSIITQLGRQNETGDGKPLPMVIETHPGGRWYRDLGGDNGHLWAYVQSIKRPAAARVLGPALHVHRRDLEHAVPPDGEGWRHAHRLQAHRGRAVPRRAPHAALDRMEGHARAREARRRSGREVGRTSP